MVQLNQSACTYFNVYGKKVKALIDTGSNLSYINKQLAEHLLKNNCPAQALGAPLNIVTAGPQGVALNQPHTFKFPLSTTDGCLQMDVTAVELPKADFDIILGLAGLHELGGSVTMEGPTLKQPMSLTNQNALVLTGKFTKHAINLQSLAPFVGKVELKSLTPGVEIKVCRASPTFSPYARKYSVYLRSSSGQTLLAKRSSLKLSARYKDMKTPVLVINTHKLSSGLFVNCPDCPREESSTTVVSQHKSSPFQAVFRLSQAVVSVKSPAEKKTGKNRAMAFNKQADFGDYSCSVKNRFDSLAVEEAEDLTQDGEQFKSSAIPSSPPHQASPRKVNLKSSEAILDRAVQIDKIDIKTISTQGATSTAEIGVQTEGEFMVMKSQGDGAAGKINTCQCDKRPVVLNSSVAVQADPQDHPPLVLSDNDLKLQDQHREYMASIEKEKFLDLFQIQESNLDTDQVESLQEVLFKHRAAFRPPDTHLPLPPASVPPVSLPVKGNKPEFRKPRPVKWSTAKIDWASAEIDRLVKIGVLEPSTSNFVSDILLVPKPTAVNNGAGEGWRLCVDLRLVNSYLISMVSTTPYLHTLIDAMGQGSPEYMSSLDIQMAFHQVSLQPNSRDLLTIQCPKTFRKWRYTRLCFGSSLSPLLFQESMQILFSDLLNKQIFLYFDDFSVVSPSFQAHIQTLDLLLGRMAGSCISLNPKKCKFGVKSILYLGYELSTKGYHPAPNKLSFAANILAPTTSKQLSSLLGFFQFFRHTIPQWAKLSAPLYDAAKKTKQFAWSSDHEKCLKQIKTNFVEHSQLSYPDYKYPLEIWVDSSLLASGATLVQRIPTETGEDIKFIAFTGRKLKARQQKYSVCEIELLGAATACLLFEDYLANTSEVTICTDHQALIPIMKQGSQVNGRIARLVATLVSFNAKLVYVPGKTFYVPDLLSRLENWPENEAETMINHRLFADFVTPEDREGDMLTRCNIQLAEQDKERHAIAPDPLSVNQLTTSQRQDQFCSAMLQYLEDDTLKNVPQALEKEILVTSSKFLTHQGILYKVEEKHGQCKQVLVVPKELVPAILEYYHDSQGHPGIKQMSASIQLKFWWKKLNSDINTKVKSCDICAHYKVVPQFRSAKTGHWAISHVGESIQCDVAGPFVPSLGYSYCLVILDDGSRRVVFKALKDLTAGTIARALIDYFWSYGFVRNIRCDNFPSFQSALINKICELLEIQNVQIPAYSPFCQGKVERMVKNLKDRLVTLLAGGNLKKWPMLLNPIAYAINTAPHASFGYEYGLSPSMLFFGRHLLSPLDITLPNQAVSIPSNICDQYYETVREVIHAQEVSRETLLNNMDKFDKGKSYEYKEGQLVLLYVQNLKSKAGGLMRKFQPRYLGPFIILSKISESVVQLGNPETREKLKNLVNVRYIKPYYDRLQRGTYTDLVDPTDPPPTLIYDTLPREAIYDVLNNGPPSREVIDVNKHRLGALQSVPTRGDGHISLAWPYVTQQNQQAVAIPMAALTPLPPPPPLVGQLPVTGPVGCAGTQSNNIPLSVAGSPPSRVTAATKVLPQAQGDRYNLRSRTDPTVKKDYSNLFQAQVAPTPSILGEECMDWEPSDLPPCKKRKFKD